ncbi:SCAN domain-containing protein 1-like [Podarcis raffonei]|uniref:SCAN domain-containing protein 1-like n=1 Tax=Podarcis raffonei TaxID=65483 RepID=UPI0023290A60|nr:SCAN domain-containing protein 1-like [Podarcis raffonei]XP_053254292.1 SCAN domain-containing protein 1-like [Podarcis raffonei]XP_053254293.1 SCAN domain-containing protein 1-like [Podarcis raffonei]XP_053254294.1 SCAN domain-containing protein 1-like [Podarcis raffonei]
MATKVNEQSLDASCSDPAKERDPGSTNMAEHQDLDRGEAKAAGECSGGGAEHSEMTQQPTDQCQAPRLQVKQEEKPKTEKSLVPPAAEASVSVPVLPLGEGKGAKRMMEDDDSDADIFKEMPDVCQEAREPGRAMLLPDLFGEAQQAHSSLAAGRAGGCAKVEQAIPCLPNVGSENQRKRFRGFAYKETEGPQVAYERLQELLFQWLKPEARSKEEIVEQLVLEQFLNLLPEDVQRWVRERHPENGDEAVALAEDYQFLHPEPGRRPYPERARQRSSARSWLR